MKTPKSFIKENIFTPIYKFHTKFLTKKSLHKGVKKFADIIYKHGGDPALNMVVFNSICIISSHWNQLIGLKKSKRENKDYLIKQELAEFAFDGIFSVIPPFFIHMFVAEKFESSKWITKSAKKNMEEIVALVCGVGKQELFDTSHLTKVDEFFPKMRDFSLDFIKKNKYTPSFISEKIKVEIPDVNQQFLKCRTDELTKRADNLKKKTFKSFYKGSAYSEISGQKNGLIMLIALGYTIFSCSVITPILKNLFANYMYKKSKKNEIPSKNNFTSSPIYKDSNVFNVFSNVDNSLSSTSKKDNVKNIYDNNEIISSKNNPFASFEKFSNQTFTSRNMKI